MSEQAYGVSILSLFRDVIDYKKNKEMISAFKRFFPRANKQLDILYALKVD